MLLRIMYLLLRPNEIFVFSRLFMEFGTSQFQFTLIKFKNIRWKNNINLSMLSETYLGKCNFKKSITI